VRRRSTRARSLRQPASFCAVTSSSGSKSPTSGLGELRTTGLMLLVYVQHRSLLREGARALSAADLPRAPPSAVRRHAGQGGDVPLPPRHRRAVGRRRAASAAAGRAVHDPAGHAALVPGRRGGRRRSEFSSTSRDDLDVFTDPRIVRAPHVGDAAGGPRADRMLARQAAGAEPPRASPSWASCRSSAKELRELAASERRSATTRGSRAPSRGRAPGRAGATRALPRPLRHRAAAPRPHA
jgi:hypothetical protein